MPCLANQPMHTAYGTLETFSWVSALFIKFLVVYKFVFKCFKTCPSHPLMKTHNKYFLRQGWGIIFWNILKFLSLVFICSEFHLFICSYVNVFESFTFVFTFYYKTVFKGQGNTILTYYIKTHRISIKSLYNEEVMQWLSMIYVSTKDVDSYDKLVYMSEHLAWWWGKSIVIKPPHNKLHYVKYIFAVISLSKYI